jgi:predicted Zn-dependent protease
MNDPHIIAQQTLLLLPPNVEGRVTASSGSSALTRFANSFIHQNVAEEGSRITLTVARGKQVATAAANVSDNDALARFVQRVVDIADLAPEMDDWPGVTGGEPVIGHVPEPGADEVTPRDRAEQVEAFVDAAPDMRAAGYCQTEHGQTVLMDTSGLVASGHSASAIVDGIHQTERSAGSGHTASRRFADIDAEAAGSLAADRARRSETTTDVAPGEYEVVLAPEAAATIVIFLALYGFNGKQVAEGQSFAKVGEQQFDPAFELVDDGARPEAMGVGFDSEGTAKRRVELVVDGVVRNLAVDRRQAAKLGMETTGHAAELYGSYFGPLTSDLMISPGERSPDELIGSIERGLYVSTFNYCRILDPRTTVTTGLTRNGTFIIENGQIVGAASNLRFTQSFAGALAPGNVVGVGNDARMADCEFGPGLVHAPSIHLRSWRFTGGASG